MVPVATRSGSPLGCFGDIKPPDEPCRPFGHFEYEVALVALLRSDGCDMRKRHAEVVFQPSFVDFAMLGISLLVLDSTIIALQASRDSICMQSVSLWQC